VCEAPTTPLKEDDRHFCLALVYHAPGRQADAEHELEQFKTLHGDGAPYSVVQIYAQWGNAVSALQWLTKAERFLDPNLEQVRVEPLLDPIRHEPQFKALLARMKFPP
jgi:hypothetical protein